MKKIITALTAAMALASCSQDQSPSQAAAAPPGISSAPAAPATQSATVAASTLSLRATASRTGRRIGTLRQGDEVEVLDATDNWALVMVGASEGYVEREYLHTFAAR